MIASIRVNKSMSTRHENSTNHDCMRSTNHGCVRSTSHGCVKILTKRKARNKISKIKSKICKNGGLTAYTVCSAVHADKCNHICHAVVINGELP